MTADAPVRPAFSVRRATPADVPAVLELRLAFDRELDGDPPPDRGPAHEAALHAYLDSHLPDGRFLVWLAETAEGRPVGMAGLVTVDRPPLPRSRRNAEGFVFNVYTVPEWRRRGVARALMEAIRDHARAVSLRRLILRTSEQGRSLYDGLGFTDPGWYRQLDLD